MNCATKTRRTQIVVGLIWVVAFLAFALLPQQPIREPQTPLDVPVLPDRVLLAPSGSAPFSLWPRCRLRKWAWRRYIVLRRAHRHALCVARMARLALRGALTLAQVVDWLTATQFRRQLGALPVLYALLETLQVREVINRYCPTEADVDHGTVALVLILNRLTMPLPQYKVAGWMAQTVLIQILGVPADKFNDDRLARTLDALQPHCQAIWEEIAHRALAQAKVDLSVLFYDLTAYVTHGAYSDSEHVDFGFANNTPMRKRKFKNGLDVSADGNMPVGYALWSGRTTDLATVEENMKRLKQFMQRHGYPLERLLIITDRGNLSDKLALTYDEQRIHYLSGLRVLRNVHRELLSMVPAAQLYAHPLTDVQGPNGYWGVLCTVPFEHRGRKATHRGLIVLSGPMRTALRQTRAVQLWALRQALQEVRDQIGTPRCRTVRGVQRCANAKLNASPVGKFVRAQATADEQGQVHLRCWVDRYALWQACERDGRYLLVTNDWSLFPRQMLALYHQKDGVEKRIRVSKHDLKVSPVYLHKDERIEAMLLVNMLALLAYSLLERQVRQNGLQITTRQIIAKLQSLDVVVTRCWDGSQLYRLVPMDEEQAALLQVLVDVLADLSAPGRPHAMLSAEQDLPLALSLPHKPPLLT